MTLIAPAHISGPFRASTKNALKVERTAWIKAQIQHGYSSGRIASALGIEVTVVREIAKGLGLEFATRKPTLLLAPWEDPAPCDRSETAPRFTLIRPAPEPDLIAPVIAAIRAEHARHMGAKTCPAQLSRPRSASRAA